METQYRPTYDDEHLRDDVELDVEDAFGDHDVEYWVRKGNKLVPATEDEVAQIHEWERDSAARARLALWKRAETSSWSAGLLRGILLRGAMWLRHWFGPPRSPEPTGREQEQRAQFPLQPRTPGGHDEHGDETAL